MRDSRQKTKQRTREKRKWDLEIMPFGMIRGEAYG